MEFHQGQTPPSPRNIPGPDLLPPALLPTAMAPRCETPSSLSKTSWHLCIFARSRHRKPSISLNPCFQGPILLQTDYESRLHILNKPLFTAAFNSLQCIMCMCILAWQALTYCFDCYRLAMKGPIVWGSQDYITAPTRAPAEVFDQGSQVGRSERGARSLSPYLPDLFSTAPQPHRLPRLSHDGSYGEKRGGSISSTSPDAQWTSFHPEQQPGPSPGPGDLLV